MRRRWPTEKLFCQHGSGRVGRVGPASGGSVQGGSGWVKLFIIQLTRILIFSQALAKRHYQLSIELVDDYKVHITDYLIEFWS